MTPRDFLGVCAAACVLWPALILWCVAEGPARDLFGGLAVLAALGAALRVWPALDRATQAKR